MTENWTKIRDQKLMILLLMVGVVIVWKISVNISFTGLFQSAVQINS